MEREQLNKGQIVFFSDPMNSTFMYALGKIAEIEDEYCLIDAGDNDYLRHIEFDDIVMVIE